jgi:hypothetical protein
MKLRQNNGEAKEMGNGSQAPTPWTRLKGKYGHPHVGGVWGKHVHNQVIKHTMTGRAHHNIIFAQENYGHVAPPKNATAKGSIVSTKNPATEQSEKVEIEMVV